MTPEQQQQKLRRADPLLCEAHSLILDVFLARDAAGERVEGDAISSILTLLNKAITTLRDSGESPDYYAAWERLPETPSP